MDYGLNYFKQKIPPEELQKQKKSFEQKLQKTAANLRAAENHLPPSIVRMDSELIPNSVSTKTFKQGQTLHGLLCSGIGHHSTSQKHVDAGDGDGQRDSKRGSAAEDKADRSSRIPIYRNLNSTGQSTSSVDNSLNFHAPFRHQQPRAPLVEKNPADDFEFGGPRRRLNFSGILEEEYCYVQTREVNGQHFSPFSSTPKNVHIMQNGGIAHQSHSTVETNFNSPFKLHNNNEFMDRSLLSEQAIDADEYFESAFEESFNSEEREVRELSHKSFGGSTRSRFSSSNGSTPVKDINSFNNFSPNTNGITKAIHKPQPRQENYLVESADERTLKEQSSSTDEKFTTAGSNVTWVDDLNKSVHEVRLMLDNAAEKLGTMVNRFDRTMNSQQNVGGSGNWGGGEQATQEDQEEEAGEEHGREANDRDRPFVSHQSPLAMTTVGAARVGMRATQTPVDWQTQPPDPIPLESAFMGVIRSHSAPDQPGGQSKTAKGNKMRPADGEKLADLARFNCKYLLRHRIDALKDHTRVRLFILEEERKSAPKSEREEFSNRFRKLMNEYDATKARIKAELKTTNLDKKIVEKHWQELSRLQNDTRCLQTKFQALLLIKGTAMGFEKRNILATRESKSNFIENVGMLPAAAVDPISNLSQLSSDMIAAADPEMIHANDNNDKADTLSNFSEELNSNANEKIDSSNAKEKTDFSNANENIDILATAERHNSSNLSELFNSNEKNPRSELSEMYNSNENLSQEEPNSNEKIDAPAVAEHHSSSILSEVLDSNEKEADEEEANGYNQQNEKADGLQSAVDPNSSLSEELLLDSAGDTSEGITSLPYPSESVADRKGQHTIESNPSVLDELSSLEDSPASTFRPSEKSLHSILSSKRSSDDRRDSMGKRRDSATEALLKLRQMNGVPPLVLGSPRRPKSPPKTALSPLVPERFITKYPHQSVSRESSISEDILDVINSNNNGCVVGRRSSLIELLEELPNASQIGMVLDLSNNTTPQQAKPSLTTIADIDEVAVTATEKESVSGTSAVLDDAISHERQFVEAQASKLWEEYLELGTEYAAYPEITGTEGGEEDGQPGYGEDQQKEHSFGSNAANNFDFDKDFLGLYCREHVGRLIRTEHFSSASRMALSSREALTDNLQRAVASISDGKKKESYEFVSKGARVRAEQVSHVLLDTNRLLLAQHVYEEQRVWPNGDELAQMDLMLIDALIGEEEATENENEEEDKPSNSASGEL